MHQLAPGQCYRLPTGERVIAAVFLVPWRGGPGAWFTVTPTGRVLELDEAFWADGPGSYPDGRRPDLYGIADTGLSLDELARDPRNDLTPRPDDAA
jgi:hypothetical protein